MSEIIFNTVRKAVVLAVAFSALLIVWALAEGGSIRGSLPYEPIAISFAVIASAPFDKKNKQLGGKFYAFLASWLVLGFIVLWVGFKMNLPG